MKISVSEKRHQKNRAMNNKTKVELIKKSHRQFFEATSNLIDVIEKTFFWIRIACYLVALS
jgi:hypothetical protein